jgi:hypothetical protein
MTMDPCCLNKMFYLKTPNLLFCFVLQVEFMNENTRFMTTTNWLLLISKIICSKNLDIGKGIWYYKQHESRGGGRCRSSKQCLHHLECYQPNLLQK